MAKKTDKTKPAPTSASRALEMEKAWALFDQGRNRAARREAKAVLAQAASDPSKEKAKEEARDLLGRTDLDPGVIATIAIVALVLGGIVVALALRR